MKQNDFFLHLLRLYCNAGSETLNGASPPPEAPPSPFPRLVRDFMPPFPRESLYAAFRSGDRALAAARILRRYPRAGREAPLHIFALTDTLLDTAGRLPAAGLEQMERSFEELLCKAESAGRGPEYSRALQKTADFFECCMYLILTEI